MRGASVKRTSNLATPNSNTIVTFDTAEYDDDGFWSAGSPTRLTIPAAHNGKRAVLTATAIWETNSSGYRELKAFKNGNSVNPVAVAQNAAAGANTGVVMISRPLAVATADYYELVARADTASQSALYEENYSITFAIEIRTIS